MTPPSPSLESPSPGFRRALRSLRSYSAQTMMAMSSGLLLGLSMPGHLLPFAWIVVLVPLFTALEFHHRQSEQRLLWRTLKAAGLCWWVGVMMAAVSGGWVVNTSHVFGGLPLPVAHAVNVLGYGTLQGIDTFLFLGIPFGMLRRNPWLRMLLVLLWSTALMPLAPRFLYWTYGQLMFDHAPLVQAADLIGSSGLNLLVVGLNLLLFGWLVGHEAGWRGTRRTLTLASAVLVAGFVAAWTYGHWRMAAVATAERDGSAVRLVGIQPNFSLKAIASNPDLSPSDREQSLLELIRDSERALQRLPAGDDAPTVVVWPESAYPGGYARNPEMRRFTEEWVRSRGVHLVLATVDGPYRTQSRRGVSYYGASVHIGPAGLPLSVYRKIVLIPFGETIPLAELFPWYGDFIRKTIPRIAEFTPGDKFTVFNVSPSVRLAPMICFDAARYEVSAGMTRAGANLGLVLANLAWFGATSVSEQFSQYIRFRAIENRIPMLMLSQNGASVLFDARGEVASPLLKQFEADAVVTRIRLPDIPSFYARYTERVHGAFLLLLGAFLGASYLSRLSGLRKSRQAR